MKKINKFEYENEWHLWVGGLVEKHSGEKFKGGEHRGIVVDMAINPYTNNPAFKLDDDSLVDCYQCKLV